MDSGLITNLLKAIDTLYETHTTHTRLQIILLMQLSSSPTSKSKKPT